MRTSMSHHGNTGVARDTCVLRPIDDEQERSATARMPWLGDDGTHGT
jgi:hypothetical protein